MTTNATPKIKGPASYFPSIEKTYGEPVSHWMAVLKQAGPLPVVVQVEWCNVAAIR